MSVSPLLQWILDHSVAVIGTSVGLAAVALAIVVLVGRGIAKAAGALWSGVVRRDAASSDGGVAGWLAGLTHRGRMLAHLVIGAALSLTAAWGFEELFDALRSRQGLFAIDAEVASQITSRVSVTELAFFGTVTSLASGTAIIVIGVGVGLLFLVRRRRILLLGWVAALAGAAGLNHLLKDLIRRPRPTPAIAVVHPTTWSFPSGHSIYATVVYGLLAYLIIRERRLHWWGTAAVVACAAALILAIGFSRVVLAAHFPSDVLAGFAVGVFWLSFVTSALESTSVWDGDTDPGDDG